MKLESIGSSYLRADEIPVPFQMTAVEAPLGVFVATGRPGAMMGSTSSRADRDRHRSTVCHRCPPSPLTRCAELRARTASGSWAEPVAPVTRAAQDGRGVEVPLRRNARRYSLAPLDEPKHSIAILSWR